MRKRFIFLFLALAMLATLGYFYVHNIFLPVKLKALIEEKGRAALNREVTVEELDFKFFKGFVAKNIRITQKDDPTKNLLFIKEISFNLLLTSFLKNKTVIIPSITIDSPYVSVDRLAPDRWNFSDLLNKKRPDEQPEAAKPSLLAESGVQLFVRTFQLKNGTVDYIDLTPQEPFYETIQNINIVANMSLNKTADFNISAMIPSKGASIKTEGSVHIPTQKAQANITLKSVPVDQYLALFNKRETFQLPKGVIEQANLNLTADHGVVQVKGRLETNPTEMKFRLGRMFYGKLSVNNIALTWKDQQLTGQLNVTAPDARLVMPTGQIYNGNLTAAISSITVYTASLLLKGTAQLENARLTLADDRFITTDLTASNLDYSSIKGQTQLKTDLALNNFILRSPLVTIQGQGSTSHFSLDYDDVTMNIATGLRLTGSQTAFNGHTLYGDFSSEDTRIQYVNTNSQTSVAGTFQADNGRFLSVQGMEFLGNPRATLQLTYAPLTPKNLTYEGRASLSNATLNGVPRINILSNITGTVDYTDTSVSSKDLTLTSHGSAFNLTGGITNFKNPQADIVLHTNALDLGRLSTAFPDTFAKIKSDVTGQAAAHLTFKGSIRQPQTADITIMSELKSARVTSQHLPTDITELNGRLRYSKDLLSWEQLSGVFMNTPCAITGKLENFSRPKVYTSFDSPDLKLNTQINILNGAFQFPSLTGIYFKSAFDIRGDVRLEENAAPHIDMRGAVKLNLNDLSRLLPQYKSNLDIVKPQGQLAIDGLFQGQPGKWQDWNLTFTAQTDALRFMDYPFKNIAIKYTQRDQHVSDLTLTSNIYDGTFTLKSSADLIDQHILMKTAVQLNDMNLNTFRLDKRPKFNRLSGKTTLNANINGPLDNLNALDGSGTLVIREGLIGETEILRGIVKGVAMVGSILAGDKANQLEKYSKIYFTDAQSAFTIKGTKIYTTNTQIYGNAIDLKLKGSLDINQKIDMEVFPYYEKLDTAKPEWSDAIFRLPVSIKCSGTVSEPVCEKGATKIIGNAIGTTVGTTLETLKEVGEGILGNFEDMF